MRETIRLRPSPFRVSGPTEEFEVETWACKCRDWPIVVASSLWDESKDGWTRQYYDVRKCGICKAWPMPKEAL